MATILPFLTVFLPFVFQILLLIGAVVCLKRSFIEGGLFFVLMIIYEIFVIYASRNLEQFPTIDGTVSKLLLIIAFSILILGIYRKQKLK